MSGGVKVKRLIKELKHYNPEARVVVDTGRDSEKIFQYCRGVSWVYDEECLTNHDLVELV